MANLLYAEYNKGCCPYWYDDAYSPADYHYGDNAVMACYYADLEPNTTYTIQRIDTSTRFRVALSSQDLKYLSASSDTSVSSPFSWGYKADSSDAITFTTTATATHLVVYYTNNSEYNTKVMLNEGSSIEPYEAPTKYFKGHWRLINGELVYNGMPEPIDYLTPPYPISMWRLDSDNDLVTLLFPEALDSFTSPYPATMWYLDEDNKLMNALLPDELITGAFMDCIALKDVSIPKSVKSIGEYAFYNTALKSVRISRGCTYYPTSFPVECEIQFYDDEPNDNTDG